MATAYKQPIIYLDAAATTPCIDEVMSAMAEFSTEQYGNPSSPHRMGRFAKRAIDQATNNIAQLLGCACEDVVFTSGATESNNIVMLGSADPGSLKNIVICPIDHKSTIEAAGEMERRGIEVRRMKVDADGCIDLGHLAHIVDSNTALVSLSHVNSEIGTIQNIAKIGELLIGLETLFHIDASQAVGKVDIKISDTRVDCVSISAHKINGPKGVGALFVSSVAASRLRPLIFGGGQHRLRSGTLPVPLAVGFGVAIDRINKGNLSDWWGAANLRRTLILEIFNTYDINYLLNSPDLCAVPHILNISFPGVRSEVLINALFGVCVASGSACNSKTLAPSYVLRGIGCDDERANCAIRLSFTPNMSIEEVTIGANLVASKVESFQKLICWERVDD